MPPHTDRATITNEGQLLMAYTPMQTSNSVKGFEDLTPEQKQQALDMFAQLRPHTEYLYEIDNEGAVRCRRYNAARKGQI